MTTKGKPGGSTAKGWRSKAAERAASLSISSHGLNHQDLRSSAADVTYLEVRGNTACGSAQRPGLLALGLLGGRVHRSH